MPEILSFEEALSRANTKKHILLGNGFSIALRPDIFMYNALYDNADFADIPHAEEIFEAIQTKDFETVIRLLVDMAKVLPSYEDIDPSIINRIHEDADILKNILVRAIASNHPHRPDEITDEQYSNCRAFLSHFDRKYSLNYDILLYWTLMHDELPPELARDDGFRHPECDDEATYVTWQDGNSADVYYLHGALHLFDAGYDIQKYTWSRTQVPIVDQIHEALSEDKYPLFVAEGTSRNKLEKIMHSAYLHKSLRSLKMISGDLFIFGHSLAENDDHILDSIVNGKIRSLYVSIYGEQSSPENQIIIGRANSLSEKRRTSSRRNSLEIYFFNAESANVWG